MTSPSKSRYGRLVAKRVAWVCIFVAVSAYAAQVRARMTAVPTNAISIGKKIEGYRVQYFYMRNRDVAILRVYRASDGALLAEREFTSIDFIKVYWAENYLSYDTGASPLFGFSDEGILNFPPTRLDRVLAWIP